MVAVSGGRDPGRSRAVRDAVAAGLASGELPLRRTRRPRARGGAKGPGAAGSSGGGSLAANGAGGLLARRGAREVPAASGANGEPVSLGVPVASHGRPGSVSLVGGGPGEPDLLTVRGRRLLALADVVVVDRLAPRGVLAELAPDVEVVDCGKAPGRHALTQDEINALLIERARRGLAVVRLKGGDPFVLGRGGEEALACRAAGVPVTVVPGVTSAVSVPAAAGIPVTHRGVAAALAVVSAHEGVDAVVDAARSHGSAATLVLLMGVRQLGESAAALVRAGWDATTPVAVVEQGWLPGQRTTVGTLADISELARQRGVRSPAVVVIGEVVRLREEIGDLAEAAVSARACSVARLRAAAVLEDVPAQATALAREAG